MPRAFEHRKTESELLRERPRLHAATQLPHVHPQHREAFILDKIRAGASILGVYPPDEATLAEYEASQAAD